jgi:16S rRNA (cytidine1402-2'-O)-methyltransferase
MTHPFAPETPGLFLIPTPLNHDDFYYLKSEDQLKIKTLTHFIVETEKLGRQHLGRLHLNRPIRDLSIQALNEHTDRTHLAVLIEPLKAGHAIGLISDTGCPAVADPGADLVRLTHDAGYPVYPLVGPSSILLAIMASGACGQRFRFHGYLPIEQNDRMQAIIALEKNASAFDESQIFIETPYRNMAMLTQLLSTLQPDTLLTVATDLTLPTQFIFSRARRHWPALETLPSLHKRPTVFVVHAH